MKWWLPRAPCSARVGFRGSHMLRVGRFPRLSRVLRVSVSGTPTCSAQACFRGSRVLRSGRFPGLSHVPRWLVSGALSCSELVGFRGSHVLCAGLRDSHVLCALLQASPSCPTVRMPCARETGLLSRLPHRSAIASLFHPPPKVYLVSVLWVGWFLHISLVPELAGPSAGSRPALGEGHQCGGRGYCVCLDGAKCFLQIKATPCRQAGQVWSSLTPACWRGLEHSRPGSPSFRPGGLLLGHVQGGSSAPLQQLEAHGLSWLSAALRVRAEIPHKPEEAQGTWSLDAQPGDLSLPGGFSPPPPPPRSHRKCPPCPPGSAKMWGS